MPGVRRKGCCGGTAHLAIAKAYRTAVGDAIELAQRRVRSGKTTIERLWPVDGVHPCDQGYELFADAAWDAFQKAVHEKTVCAAPAAMLHAPTYMTNARVRLATLLPLSEGWRVGRPSVVSAYFDMLMSRWLDEETIASNRSGPTGRGPAPLRVKFQGSMVMLFGESTPNSAKFRVVLDGKVVEHKSADKKQTFREFDAAGFARLINGKAYLVQVLAEGLDPGVEHALEIQPIFTDGEEQELRIESICVAGGKATLAVP